MASLRQKAEYFLDRWQEKYPEDFHEKDDEEKLEILRRYFPKLNYYQFCLALARSTGNDEWEQEIRENRIYFLESTY